MTHLTTGQVVAFLSVAAFLVAVVFLAVVFLAVVFLAVWSWIRRDDWRTANRKARDKAERKSLDWADRNHKRMDERWPS